MVKQLLIYENPVPVSAQTHRDVSVRLTGTYEFCAGLNAVPVVVAEFEKLASDAPIVFAGEGDAMMPTAVLGLAEGQNLFLDNSGAWTGRYVPAFLRRYPFVFATAAEESDVLTLCLDMAHPGVNRDGRGELLFDSAGDRTVFLEGVLSFASDYQAQTGLTRNFVAALQELELLEAATATANLPDGRKMSLSGFRKVSLSRLHALSDAELLDLFRSQQIDLIYLHLASLGQVQSLLERVRDLPADAAA